MPLKVSLLDYGAGNVRSVCNAIRAAGYEWEEVTEPRQIDEAQVIIFPGVGSFGSAMQVLHDKGYDQPLRRYLADGQRPFLGICLGMQTLFESSEEQLLLPSSQDHDDASAASANPASGTIAGLGIIPGRVVKFNEKIMAVPHIGWNGLRWHQDSPLNAPAQTSVETKAHDDHHDHMKQDDVYFVHSYHAPITPENQEWVLTSTDVGETTFISSIQRGAVVATQFHPEKSGGTGLRILQGFLQAVENGTLNSAKPIPINLSCKTNLAKRIVVALDVRNNDDGDLVVTKGDQYDVRENHREGVLTGRGGVRNLGKPVALAERYYQEGADEIAFLNITSFRQGVLEDMPMLQVLEEASKNIFVPLTVGGGIRSYTDPQSGTTWSALEVASRYFRAGADKVSLGSDAVDAAEAFLAAGGVKTGQSSIEMISNVYGVQAVVVSIDPKRVYVVDKESVDPKHVVVELDVINQRGPDGEKFCWYQCTVKGGREERDICAVTVAKVVERLGAGEIMLNCIDMDGQGKGFDLALMRAVAGSVSIPVIASSGAGTPAHFVDVFSTTPVHAALAAGMFHRKEVEIETVRTHMLQSGIPARKKS